MNELYAEWPLGRPSKAISGFGGLFGVNLLQRGLKEKKSMAQILELMMEHMYSMDLCQLLALVGLLKDGDGVVIMKVNGCPVTCLDPEHWCCIMFLFTERMVGGTRGLGTNYQVTSTHCQPVCTSRLPKEIVEGAVDQYRSLVDSGQWQKMDAMVVGVSGDVSGHGASDSDESEMEMGEGDKASHPIDTNGSTKEEDNETNGSTEEEEEETSSTNGSTEEKDNYVERAQSRKERTRSSILPYSHKNCSKVLDFDERASKREFNLMLGIDESANKRECNLMLGMIYGNLMGNVHKIGVAKNCSPQFCRDTARCLSTENCCGRDTYTLDNRGLGCRKDCHINQSICRLDPDHP
jgi:hypothetical protein